MKPQIRILIIEDNRFVREGLTEVLLGESDFAVEACAAWADLVTAEQVVQVPQVILLDIFMEEANTIKLMEGLRHRFPDSRIVAMDIMPDESDIMSFIKQGGCAFILKNATVEDYVRTIREVASGATVLPKSMAKSLFAQIVEDTLRKGKELPPEATRLTRRESEIVGLISEGLANKEIAQRLHIATFTVKSHVHNILEKLELESRLQIAAFANRAASI